MRNFVDQRRAAIGYAICIDEGGYLSQRDLAYAQRLAWDATARYDHSVTALVHRYPAPDSGNAPPIRLQ